MVLVVRLRVESPSAVAGAIDRTATLGAAGERDRVYALAPGAILASHDQSEEEAERSHLLNLRRRRTTAQDVAQAAVMLAGGDLASGETLFVDNGQHLLSQPRDVIYLEREGAR